MFSWQVCVRWWYRQPLAHCSWNVWTGPREVPYGHRYLRGLRERSGEDRCMVMVPGRAFFWGKIFGEHDVNIWKPWRAVLKIQLQYLECILMHFGSFWHLFLQAQQCTSRTCAEAKMLQLSSIILSSIALNAQATCTTMASWMPDLTQTQDNVSFQCITEGHSRVVCGVLLCWEWQ